MTRQSVAAKVPRMPMNAAFLKRKISECVAIRGAELMGAIIDPGTQNPTDPLTVNGNLLPVMDSASEVQIRDFEFRGPVSFLDHWGMLSFHETTFCDFEFRGHSSELFIGNKTKGGNVAICGSKINGLFLYDSRFLGNVVVTDTSVRILFLKRTIIEGDLDLSGLKNTNHFALIKMKVYGSVIAPSHPHLAHLREELVKLFGEKVVVF